MRFVSYLLGAAAFLAFPSVASAATLYNQTNLSDQSNTPVTLTFTAGANTTTVDFAGYNAPSYTNVTDILLTLSGGSTNLLGQTFSFTPAAFGSDANQYGGGAYGTNNLSFGGVAVGFYDTFSQTVSTVIGDSYTLSFNLSNYESPNGLMISASNAVQGVPEPATWAMMLLGFGAVGVALRRRRAGRPVLAAA